MLIKRAADLRYSDVTPKKIYFNRRKFLAGFPVAFVGARELLSPSAAAIAGTPLQNVRKSPFSTTEKQNTYKQVSTYNNYYEFGTDKEAPSENVKKFQMPSEWVVSVEGDVAKPRKFSIDDL